MRSSSGQSVVLARIAPFMSRLTQRGPFTTYDYTQTLIYYTSNLNKSVQMPSQGFRFFGVGSTFV